MLAQKKIRRSNISTTRQELPPIPNKIYFTIGEISKLCDLEAHVLRYWEQEFAQLKPSRRRGNRRYYQRKEVLLVRHIRSLLYEQGFTIEGARIQLATNNINREESITKPVVANNENRTKLLLNNIASNIEGILTELEKEEEEYVGA